MYRGSSSCVQSHVDNCEEACFVGHMMTGVKMSLFEASDDAISRLAHIHGLRTDDLDGAGCRHALAFHLMNGDCLSMVAVGTEDFSACHKVCRGFATAESMCTFVIDVIGTEWRASLGKAAAGPSCRSLSRGL
jgi:hypothetical protein